MPRKNTKRTNLEICLQNYHSIIKKWATRVKNSFKNRFKIEVLQIINSNQSDYRQKAESLEVELFKIKLGQKFKCKWY